MKLSRLAAVLIGLFLSLPGAPVEAADAHLDVSLSLRWQTGGTQGTWTPYVFTASNAGTSDFSGAVSLVPNQSRTGQPNVYPTHRAQLSVPHGSQRSIVFYVIDAPGGYHADVRDQSGRLVASASLNTSPRSPSGLAILSDLPQAEQKLSAPLRALTQVDSALVRFPSPQAFPTNAVYLSGLNGIVIDQFDSAALSQAQVQALHDFVGLGGTLIEAGGASWRRTLLPLPGDLVPLQPEATTTASLAPLADLGGLAGNVAAQVASGRLRAGRVELSAPDGTPLIVEAPYGAGSVVELAFDPFGEPFDSQPDLAALSWGQAITRALSAVQGPARQGFGYGFGYGYGYGYGFGAADDVPPAAGPGVWSPGYGVGSEQLSEILNDTRAAFSPPVGLLGALLLVYVLLAGLINYVVLKAAGRRELMWVTVPLVALGFTACAYGVGVAIRGTDFLVTEVQVQRLGPGGVVETYSFSGVYAPRRGDVELSLPANTLASTAVSFGGLGDTNNNAVIMEGPRPEVLFQNVSIWNPRSLQTLSVSHPYGYQAAEAMPIETHLRLENGHVRGWVVNHTGRSVQQLELVGATTTAPLAAQIGPGAALNVDVPFTQSFTGGRPVQWSGYPSSGGGMGAGAATAGSQAERDSVLRLAASQALGSNGDRRGQLAVVGLTSATETMQVDGSPPSRSVLAAVVEPIQLEAADTLATLPPRPRLVSTYSGDGSSQLDVFDLQVPSGSSSNLSLGYSMLSLPQPDVLSVEVYNWNSHAWRSLPSQKPPTTGAQTAALNPGEVDQGLIRVRVRETRTGQADLTVSSS